MIRRTKCPSNYLSPRKIDVIAMAKRVRIKHYSPSLVMDLAHIAAGGHTLPQSDWEPEIREIVDRTLIPPDADGFWTIADAKGGSTKSREYIIDIETQTRVEYHQRICDFLDEINMKIIPGRSPLEKSVNVLKLLASVDGGQPDIPDEAYPSQSGDDGQPDSIDEAYPIFSESHNNSQLSQSGSEIAEMLNQKIKDAGNLDDAETDLLSQCQNKSAGVGSPKDLQRMELAADMHSHKNVWLDVSRNLDKEVDMHVREKTLKLVPDLKGNNVRVRPIANFGELPKIQAAEYALPKTYRLYRAAAKIAPVRERVRREVKKQLLYMIIDTSGSMHSDSIAKAGGVLMNRLKAVIAGDASMFVRFFDTTLHPEHYAETPNEAKKLIGLFNEHNFSGGGTNIVHCAKSAQKQIQKLLDKNELLIRPELVIVTDGHDDVSIF